MSFVVFGCAKGFLNFYVLVMYQLETMSLILSPIRYEGLSQTQLKLMILSNGIITLLIGLATAYSWWKLPTPKPKLWSYAGIVHLLLGVAMFGFFIIAIISYTSF